jgi:hypothetical protein
MDVTCNSGFARNIPIRGKTRSHYTISRAIQNTIVGATRGKILTMMMRLKKTNLMRIDMLHKAETFGQGDQAKGLTLPNIDFASILFRGTRPCKAQPTYPVRAPCIVPKQPTRQMF